MPMENGGEEPIFKGSPMSKAGSMVNGPTPEKKEEAPKPAASSDNSVEIARAQIMAQLATDPDISRILSARQQNKKLRISDPDEVDREEPREPEKVNWDELTNSQMAEKLPSIFASEVDKKLSAHTKPLLEKIAQLEQAAQASGAEKVQNTIASVKARYPDFENYKKDIVQLNNQYGGAVGVEELYHLARIKNGEFGAPEKPTSSERPSTAAARPSLRELREKPLPYGRKGMQQLLNEALETVELGEFE